MEKSKTTLPALGLLHDLVRGAVDAAAIKEAGPQADLDSRSYKKYAKYSKRPRTIMSMVPIIKQLFPKSFLLPVKGNCCLGKHTEEKKSATLWVGKQLCGPGFDKIRIILENFSHPLTFNNFKRPAFIMRFRNEMIFSLLYCLSASGLLCEAWAGR